VCGRGIPRDARCANGARRLTVVDIPLQRLKLTDGVPQRQRHSVTSVGRPHVCLNRFQLIVAIELPFGGNYVELLAHEFEHVVEQIDGMDLRALARNGTGEVVQLSDGAFESARAREAGRAALSEVEQSPEPAFAVVRRSLMKIIRATARALVR
jgi:hypothetical protein